MADIVAKCIVYCKPRERAFFEVGRRHHHGQALERLLINGIVLEDGRYHLFRPGDDNH
ncbi:MAG: hypothetical protein KF766_08145 [Rhodocyclaceae bacterium]|nr:hypothetical protein [Rhodocyclaceae bacterium]